MHVAGPASQAQHGQDEGPDELLGRIGHRTSVPAHPRAVYKILHVLQGVRGWPSAVGDVRLTTVTTLRRWWRRGRTRIDQRLYHCRRGDDWHLHPKLKGTSNAQHQGQQEKPPVLEDAKWEEKITASFFFCLIFHICKVRTDTRQTLDRQQSIFSQRLRNRQWRVVSALRGAIVTL